MRYEQSWLIYRPSCLPGFGATGSPHAEIFTTELMIEGWEQICVRGEAMTQMLL